MLGLATWPALSSGALAGAEAEAVPLAQLGFCQADPGEPALAALVQTGPGAGGADLDHTHSPEPARGRPTHLHGGCSSQQGSRAAKFSQVRSPGPGTLPGLLP